MKNEKKSNKHAYPPVISIAVTLNDQISFFSKTNKHLSFDFN